MAVRIVDSSNKIRIVRKYQVDDLVGELLTYVDATYNDAEQRNAHKSIIKRAVYPWFHRAHENTGYNGDTLEKAIDEMFKRLEREHGTSDRASGKN